MITIKGCTYIYKGVALFIAVSILAADISLAAGISKRDTLSPSLRTADTNFKEPFQAGYDALAHEAVNNYIARHIYAQINNIPSPKEVTPEQSKQFENIANRLPLTELRKYINMRDDVVNGRAVLIASIPGLFENTGQVGHVGLGRCNGKPVAWLDSKFYFKQRSVESVISNDLVGTGNEVFANGEHRLAGKKRLVIDTGSGNQKILVDHDIQNIEVGDFQTIATDSGYKTSVGRLGLNGCSFVVIQAFSEGKPRAYAAAHISSQEDIDSVRSYFKRQGKRKLRALDIEHTIPKAFKMLKKLCGEGNGIEYKAMVAGHDAVLFRDALEKIWNINVPDGCFYEHLTDQQGALYCVYDGGYSCRVTTGWLNSMHSINANTIENVELRWDRESYLEGSDGSPLMDAERHERAEIAQYIEEARQHEWFSADHLRKWADRHRKKTEAFHTRAKPLGGLYDHIRARPDEFPVDMKEIEKAKARFGMAKDSPSANIGACPGEGLTDIIDSIKRGTNEHTTRNIVLRCLRENAVGVTELIEALRELAYYGQYRGICESLITEAEIEDTFGHYFESFNTLLQKHIRLYWGNPRFKKMARDTKKSRHGWRPMLKVVETCVCLRRIGYVIEDFEVTFGDRLARSRGRADILVMKPGSDGSPEYYLVEVKSKRMGYRTYDFFSRWFNEKGQGRNYVKALASGISRNPREMCKGVILVIDTPDEGIGSGITKLLSYFEKKRGTTGGRVYAAWDDLGSTLKALAGERMNDIFVMNIRSLFKNPKKRPAARKEHLKQTGRENSAAPIPAPAPKAETADPEGDGSVRTPAEDSDTNIRSSRSAPNVSPKAKRSPSPMPGEEHLPTVRPTAVSGYGAADIVVLGSRISSSIDWVKLVASAQDREIETVMKLSKMQNLDSFYAPLRELEAAKKYISPDNWDLLLDVFKEMALNAMSKNGNTHEPRGEGSVRVILRYREPDDKTGSAGYVHIKIEQGAFDAGTDWPKIKETERLYRAAGKNRSKWEGIAKTRMMSGDALRKYVAMEFSGYLSAHSGEYSTHNGNGANLMVQLLERTASRAAYRLIPSKLGASLRTELILKIDRPVKGTATLPKSDRIPDPLGLTALEGDRTMQTPAEHSGTNIQNSSADPNASAVQDKSKEPAKVLNIPDIDPRTCNLVTTDPWRFDRKNFSFLLHTGILQDKHDVVEEIINDLGEAGKYLWCAFWNAPGHEQIWLKAEQAFILDISEPPGEVLWVGSAESRDQHPIKPFMLNAAQRKMLIEELRDQRGMWDLSSYERLLSWLDDYPEENIRNKAKEIDVTGARIRGVYLSVHRRRLFSGQDMYLYTLALKYGLPIVLSNTRDEDGMVDLDQIRHSLDSGILVENLKKYGIYSDNYRERIEKLFVVSKGTVMDPKHSGNEAIAAVTDTEAGNAIGNVYYSFPENVQALIKGFWYIKGFSELIAVSRKLNPNNGGWQVLIDTVMTAGKLRDELGFNMEAFEEPVILGGQVVAKADIIVSFAEGEIGEKYLIVDVKGSGSRGRLLDMLKFMFRGRLSQGERYAAAIRDGASFKPGAQYSGLIIAFDRPREQHVMPLCTMKGYLRQKIELSNTDRQRRDWQYVSDVIEKRTGGRTDLLFLYNIRDSAIGEKKVDEQILVFETPYAIEMVRFDPVDDENVFDRGISRHKPGRAAAAAGFLGSLEELTGTGQSIRADASDHKSAVSQQGGLREYLTRIRDNGKIIADMLDPEQGVNSSACSTQEIASREISEQMLGLLAKLGVLEEFGPHGGLYRFAAFMKKQGDPEFTKNMINYLMTIPDPFSKDKNALLCDRQNIPEGREKFVKDFVRLHAGHYLHMQLGFPSKEDTKYRIFIWNGYAGPSQSGLVDYIKRSTRGTNCEVTFGELDEIARMAVGAASADTVVIAPEKINGIEAGQIIAGIGKDHLNMDDLGQLGSIIGMAKSYLADDEDVFYQYYEILSGKTDYLRIALSELKKDPGQFVSALKFVLQPITAQNVEDIRRFIDSMQRLLTAA